MDALTLFRIIKNTVIQQSILALAITPILQVDISGEITRFYDQFELCLETEDSAHINSILSDWCSAQTQTDIMGNPSNLTQIIRRLMTTFTLVCKNTLGKSEFLYLMVPASDHFGYALEKAAEYQIEFLRNTFREQSQTMELEIKRLEISKSTFISIAAHELRTPLTLIEGYAMMLQDMEKKNYGKLDRDSLLKGILTGASRLRSIIDDMIDVSIIDNGMLTLNTQPVLLSTIFESLLYEFEEIIKERHQSINIISFPGLNHRIEADPDRLMQVFRNVINNAIKFTPDNGKITINGRLLPGYTEVTITDTGIGIAPENQMHIFEKFGGLGNALLHSSSKSKFKGGGPGLGLSIAKGIIEAHQGTIWVESEGFDEIKCPGSTFHIILPHKQPAKPNSSLSKNSQFLHEREW